MKTISRWTKPISALSVLLLLIYFLPSAPIDPWKILNLKKIVTLIFALMLIQVIGSVSVRLLGLKTGAILTGFLGGLISSTATTAEIARKSKESQADNSAIATLTFLSATCAMLFECILLLLLGINETHSALFLIFLGPTLVTGIMIFFQSRKVNHQTLNFDHKNFEVLPILKLSVFIVFVLAISKILQKFLGQNGIFILTFLASLFEIHGSVIANIQLHEANDFNAKTLAILLVISVAASYLSKLFLLATVGSSALRSKVLKCTAILFASLFLSWLLTYTLNIL